MIINVDLTEQEEKAMALICQGETGIKPAVLAEQLDMSTNDLMKYVIPELRRKGFEFNVLDEIKLSSSCVHYDSLIKK